MTILTKSKHRGAIEAAIRTDEIRSRVRFAFVDTSGLLNKGRLLRWVRYDHWQAAALKEARRLHAEKPFDLVHHVTFATWRIPTLLHKLGIPVVWGPVGGAQDMPQGFASILGKRGLAWESLRFVTQRLSKFDPRLRFAIRKYAAVLAANSGTAEFLRALGAVNVDQMCEMGLDLEQFPPPQRTLRPDGPLRILWVGGLEPRKALPLLLHALSIPGVPDSRVEVVGDGPDRKHCEGLTRSLGLENRVTFAGLLPRSETLKRFNDADVFVFCSLRETTGWVLVEAMASGLPVVALDLAAAHDLLGKDFGILVEPRGVEATVQGIAEGLKRLAADAQLRRRMGESARKFVERELTWTAYGERLERVYQNVAKEGRP